MIFLVKHMKIKSKINMVNIIGLFSDLFILCSYIIAIAMLQHECMLKQHNQLSMFTTTCPLL